MRPLAVAEREAVDALASDDPETIEISCRILLLAERPRVFDDVGSFVTTTVTDRLSFAGVELSRGRLEHVRGHVVFTESGAITVPTGEFSFYDVSDSTIGDVDIDMQSGDETGTFRYFHVRNTDFDGFDFGRYKTELAETKWQLHSTHLGEFWSSNDLDRLSPEAVAEAYDLDVEALEPFDLAAAFGSDDGEADGAGAADVGSFGSPHPEEMENTYLKAKNGASASGDNKAAAEFFRYERKYRRQVHLRKLLDSGDAGGRRVLSGFNFVSNLVMDKTTGSANVRGTRF